MSLGLVTMSVPVAMNIVFEDIEETILKLLKPNKDEFIQDKISATDKYFKMALHLKSIARAYLEDNKEEFIQYIEFGIKNDKINR